MVKCTKSTKSSPSTSLYEQVEKFKSEISSQQHNYTNLARLVVINNKLTFKSYFLFLAFLEAAFLETPPGVPFTT